MNDEAWPALPYAEWAPTKKTLHMVAQMVGKTRLALAPSEAEWLGACLYLDPRGFTTGAIPFGTDVVSCRIDVYDVVIRIDVSDGRRAIRQHRAGPERRGHLERLPGGARRPRDRRRHLGEAPGAFGHHAVLGELARLARSCPSTLSGSTASCVRSMARSRSSARRSSGAPASSSGGAASTSPCSSSPVATWWRPGTAATSCATTSTPST